MATALHPGDAGGCLHPSLELPEEATVVSKGTDPEDDGYSAFERETSGGQGLIEAHRGIAVEPGDEARAVDEMLRAGATTATLATLEETLGESGTEEA